MISFICRPEDLLSYESLQAAPSVADLTRSWCRWAEWGQLFGEKGLIHVGEIGSGFCLPE